VCLDGIGLGSRAPSDIKEVVAVLLHRCKKLKTIELRKNALGVAGVDAVVKAIMEAECTPTDARLRHLSLHSNKIGGGGSGGGSALLPLLLADATKHRVALHTLQLSLNNIDTTTISEMKMGFTTSTTIAVVDFAKKQVGR